MIHGFTLVSEWALLGTIILFAAWLTTLLLRRNAGMRHLTWLIAFSALLIVPGVTAIVPSSHVFQLQSAAFHSSVSPGIGMTSQGAARVESSGSGRVITSIQEWRGIEFGLACVWVMGFVTITLHGVLAIYRLGVHRHTSVKYSFDALDPAELSAKVGMKRRWELRVSETSNLGSAMTWGNRNPVVLLPQASVSWPKNRLEVVLLHELAHVRRRDSLTQMLAFIVCALYWFNPAVWLCSRAMRAEAELAADDVVLLCGIRPSFYAGELLRFASLLGQKSRPFHPIGIAFMKHPKIEKRIRSIVDPARSRFRVKLIQVLSAVAIGAFGVIALASLRPTVPILSQRAPSSADSFSPLQKASGPTGKRRAPAPDRGKADLPAYRASSDSRERQIPKAHGNPDSLRRSNSSDEFIAPDSDVFANAEPALKKSRTTNGAGADSPPASADSLPRSKPGLPRIPTQSKPESPDNNTPPSESEDSLPTNR